jgi:hypothetical protein
LELNFFLLLLMAIGYKVALVDLIYLDPTCFGCYTYTYGYCYAYAYDFLKPLAFYMLFTAAEV